MPQPTQAGGVEHGLPDRFSQIEGGNRDPVITKPTTSTKATQPFLPRNIIKDIAYRPDENNALFLVNDNGFIANNIISQPRTMIYYNIGKQYKQENAEYYQYPAMNPPGLNRIQFTLGHQTKLHKTAWRPLIEPDQMNTPNYFAFIVGETTRNSEEIILSLVQPDIETDEVGILLFIPSFFSSTSPNAYKYYDPTTTDTFYQKNPVRNMTSFTCNDENGDTWTYPENSTFFDVCWKQKTYPENLASRTINKAYIVGTQRINNAFRPKVYEIIVGNFTNATDTDPDPQFEIRDISPNTDTIANAIFWSCSYEETENKLYVTGQRVNTNLADESNPLLPFFSYDFATESWTNLSTVTDKTASNISTGNDMFLQPSPNGTYLVSKTTDFSTLDIIKGDSIIITDTTSSTYPIPEYSRQWENREFADPNITPFTNAYLNNLMLGDNGIFQIDEINGHRLKVDKKMFLYNFRFAYLSANISATDTTITLIARYHVDNSEITGATEIDLDFPSGNIFPAPAAGSTNSIIIDEEIMEYSAVSSVVNTAGVNAGFARIETYTLTISQRGADSTTPEAHPASKWASEPVVIPDSPEVSNYAIFVEEMPFIISNKFNDIKWRPDMLTSLITGDRQILRYDRTGFLYNVSDFTLPDDINPGKTVWNNNIANILLNTNSISYALQYTGKIENIDIVSYTVLNGIDFNLINSTIFGGNKLYTLTASQFTIPASNPLFASIPRNIFPQNTMTNFSQVTGFADNPATVLSSQLISIEDIKTDSISIMLYQKYNPDYNVQSGMVNYVDIFLYPFIVPTTKVKQSDFYYDPETIETNLQYAVYMGRYIVYNKSNKQSIVDNDLSMPLNQFADIINISKPPWAKYISMYVTTPYKFFSGTYEQSIDVIITGQEG